MSTYRQTGTTFRLGGDVWVCWWSDVDGRYVWRSEDGRLTAYRDGKSYSACVGKKIAARNLQSLKMAMWEAARTDTRGQK